MQNQILWSRYHHFPFWPTLLSQMDFPKFKLGDFRNKMAQILDVINLSTTVKSYTIRISSKMKQGINQTEVEIKHACSIKYQSLFEKFCCEMWKGEGKKCHPLNTIFDNISRQISPKRNVTLSKRFSGKYFFLSIPSTRVPIFLLYSLVAPLKSSFRLSPSI